MNNRVDKRSKHIGPGGFKCGYCNPYGFNRQRARRMMRRIAKREMFSLGE